LISLLEDLKVELEKGILAINAGVLLEDIRYLQLLTTKPFIYLFNIDESSISDAEKHNLLAEFAPSENTLFVSAKLEAELSELSESDTREMMDSYGLKESGLERLSALGYKTLGLQSFLTAGEKETKAWTVRIGSHAPQAAGVIHGDFERGFIAADVVSYDDLVSTGSWSKAQAYHPVCDCTG